MAVKLSALERIVKGEPVKRICDELSVGKSTANDCLQNRKIIQDFCTQTELDKALSSHCTLKKPNNEIVDDAFGYGLCKSVEEELQSVVQF